MRRGSLTASPATASAAATAGGTASKPGLRRSRGVFTGFMAPEGAVSGVATAAPAATTCSEDTPLITGRAFFGRRGAGRSADDEDDATDAGAGGSPAADDEDSGGGRDSGRCRAPLPEPLSISICPLDAPAPTPLGIEGGEGAAAWARMATSSAGGVAASSALHHTHSSPSSNSSSSSSSPSSTRELRSASSLSSCASFFALGVTEGLSWLSLIEPGLAEGLTEEGLPPPPARGVTARLEMRARRLAGACVSDDACLPHRRLRIMAGDSGDAKSCFRGFPTHPGQVPAPQPTPHMHMGMVPITVAWD